MLVTTRACGPLSRTTSVSARSWRRARVIDASRVTGATRPGAEGGAGSVRTFGGAEMTAAGAGD
ncbi:MAG TPA: hypothetical protein VHN80_32475, partial [Kineosporiaceae bacterium]|nr:hypothetical protein [Kineosporiaceae bacterium]